MKRLNFSRVRKIITCATTKGWRLPLRFGVAAAVEHDLFFKNQNFNTIVDVGANTGQFSLVMRKNFPRAKIIAFEPLKKPYSIYKSVFFDDANIRVINSAIAPHNGVAKIFVSEKDDSSSLLEISELQNEVFPGTSAVDTEEVSTGPLALFINKEEIKGRALLKLDVQGFELEVLKGSEDLLTLFDMVYCECSFYELYTGQALAPSIITFMKDKNFVLHGFNNVQYDTDGRTIQADFVFCKS